MAEHLRISVRFLGGEFHGRADNGDSEWPPSPLRLFQALTNAAARLDGINIGACSTAALRWLEGVNQVPEIYAAKVTATKGYQLYVPDNVTDLVAKQWAAGKYFDGDNHPVDISGYRTEKRVRPLRLSGSSSVHYIWVLDESGDSTAYTDVIIAIARSINCLGWGVDLVVVDAAVEVHNQIAAAYAEERWLSVETSGGNSLRVPVPGTLDDLMSRHKAFLGRIRHIEGGRQIFAPVPPHANFRVVTYRRESELDQLPFVVFALRKPDDSGFAVFDARVRRLDLTGMLRHAASRPDFATALGWDEKRVCSFVLGHDPSDLESTKSKAISPRLVFIPLPSIEWQGEKRGRQIGSIRRVLVTVQGHSETTEFLRIARALEGCGLVDEESKRPIAFLRRQTENDKAIAKYFVMSDAWTTVTPVVLPGYDDPQRLRRRLRDSETPVTVSEKEQIVRKLDNRIERLLRKALLEAGLPVSVVADADLEWSDSGFTPGVDLSSRYTVPDHCRRFRRVHVRVIWRERMSDGSLQPKSLSGPFCVGSGRNFGLGLFVPVPS